MDKTGKDALEQVDIAEAELAVLKQEGLLRHILSTGEPTAEAVAQLARLRKVAASLSGSDGMMRQMERPNRLAGFRRRQTIGLR